MSDFLKFKIGSSTLGIAQYKNDIANRKIAGGVYNLGTVNGYRDFNIYNNYIRYNGSFIGDNLGEKYSVPTELSPILRSGAEVLGDKITVEGPISDVGGLIGYTLGNKYLYYALDNNVAISSLIGSFNNRYILKDCILEGIGSFYFKRDNFIYNRMEFNGKRLFHFLNGLYDYTDRYVYNDEGKKVKDNIYYLNIYAPDEYASFFPFAKIFASGITSEDIFSAHTIEYNKRSVEKKYTSLEDYYYNEEIANDYFDAKENILGNAFLNRVKYNILNEKRSDFSSKFVNFANSIQIGDFYTFLCENEKEIKNGTKIYKDGGPYYNRVYGIVDFTSYYGYNQALIDNKEKKSYGIEINNEIDTYSVGAKNNLEKNIILSLPSEGFEQGMIEPKGNNITRILYNENYEDIDIDRNSIENGSDGEIHMSDKENSSMLSYEYGQNTNINSVIKETNKLFKEGKIGSIINRFYTSGVKKASQIESAVDSVYGLSRGRNLKKNNNAIDTRQYGYDDPYCRVWTNHYQYSHLKDRIRPFIGENGFMGIKETQRNFGGLRTTDGSERLNDNSVLQKNGYVKISSSNDGGIYDGIQKYMFSIENLAWRDVELSKNLSKEQIGPNDGRIMWFPPYNLKFTDNVTVNWNSNEFIGRGEKIYTYTDTERAGTLHFTLLIDHPSVINKWREQGKSDNAESDEREQTLLRFFAGCDVLTNEMKDAVVEEKEIEEAPSTMLRPSVTTWDVNYVVFFPNNFSGYDDLSADEIISQLKSYDTVNWEGSDESYENQILDERNKVNLPSGYDLNNTKNGEWGCREKIISELGINDEGLYSLADLTDDDALSVIFGNNETPVNNEYKIESVVIKGCASSHGEEKYNKELCKRRAATANLIMKNQFNISDEQIREEDGEILPIKSVMGYDSVNAIDAKIARCAIIRVKIALNGTASPMSDVNSESENYINQNLKNKQINANNFENSVSNDKTGNILTYVLKDGTTYESLTMANEIQPAYVVASRPKNNNEIFESQSNDRFNYDNEYVYFSNLSENDKFTYKNIVENIKYFNPAYHSITPEGFNARLTFLHQCTRQGPTQSISDKNGSGMAGNLSFGRAPYCILRIGDFFHTKIIIDALTIDYSNGDGVQWDMNPEGIGVQPMMANIDINFRFLGGQDIAGPIARLQNAVSYNYYANTSIYDRHSDYGDYRYDAMATSKNNEKNE